MTLDKRSGVLLTTLLVNYLSLSSCFTSTNPSLISSPSLVSRNKYSPQYHQHTSPFVSKNIQGIQNPNEFQISTFSTQTALYATPALSAEASNELLVYFLQTLIDVGVPTLATIIVVVIAAMSFGNAGGGNKRKFSSYLEERNTVQELYSDLYGNPNDMKNLPMFPFPRRGGGRAPLPRNLGVPSEQYIKVTHLNTKLDSYLYSLSAATQSKASAASHLRVKNFDRAVTKVFGNGSSSSDTALSSAEIKELEVIEKEFLDEGGELVAELESIQRESLEMNLNKFLTKLEKEMDYVVEAEIVKDGNTNETFSTLNTKEATNTTEGSKTRSSSSPNFVQNMMSPDKRLWTKQLDASNKINSQLATLELNFMKDVMTILGPERAAMAKTLWIGNIVDGTGMDGSLLRGIKERPLSKLLSSTKPAKQNLFVTNFPGDVSASQVSELREEVTAILRAASPGDEALLVLQSGGGTVTGYGLAAAQLRRFKANGIKLTICVEQVAASGGYMMCCVADKVIASPFAVLGSIGVISDIPNVYERLKKEGIEFQTITAGKYKRTITPTKKTTAEDLKKSKEDIEDILSLFKAFVKENRPSLDIDKVATGETWFGQDALDRNLCDEIRTKDDVLLEYVDSGYEVYEVAYEPPTDAARALFSVGGSVPGNNDGRRNSRGGIISWLVQAFVREVKNELLDDSYYSGDMSSRPKSTDRKSVV